MKSSWQLQDAKNGLSKLVDRALHEGHQTITRHGHPVVVVVSAAEFKKIKPPRNKLSDFFRESPLRGVSLDLKRRKDRPRKFEL